MYKRSDKVAFLGVTSGSSTTYTRMTGFTEMSNAKNAKEYSRQYVDEDTERSDVVGYAPSTSYKFDRFGGNAVQEILADIADNEKLGSEAHVEIVVVDLMDETSTTGHFSAAKREFAVIPNADGDSLDAYTYSGTLKACGDRVLGTATTTDGWATCSFSAAS